MLLIAIVCLQYILLQYSLCSICVDNLYVLYIYIYISAVVIKREGSCKNLNSFTVVMQKKRSYEPHMQTQSDKTFNLPLCIQ